MKGRLSNEFRGRTKKYASAVIRMFIKLPKNREEVRVLGKQLLRSELQSPRRSAKLPARVRTKNSFPNSVARFRKPTNPRSGSNCCGTIAEQRLA